MNISALENIVRRALKGENVVEQSNNLYSTRTITAAEHRSLDSLCSQIAGNVRLAGGPGAAGTVVASMDKVTGIWI